MKEDLKVYQYNNDYYMSHCEMEANKMYPDLYHKLHPYVKRKCEMEDNDYNRMMNPFPNQETVNRMVDEIHEEYKRDHGDEESPAASQKLTRFDGFIGRDLITILLLGELLGRRRRRRFYGPYGGYGGFGGYGRSPFFGY